ncbi:hypothetical protein T02_14220 [Trichinella nativa]|uniref:Uncharacterized protein n=1 Tax=Trichinella nativa TaxID=6335 RepID=A0A0V1LRX2_9BILA|nr:hypothetical protein T02_5056 [Trichinella nativa]KRZ62193.1 hypothetical protein T02_14220 [Trichinella nativa]
MPTSDEKSPNGYYLTATYVAADYIELLPFCCALQQLLKDIFCIKQFLMRCDNSVGSIYNR